jgi:hypothetical protein
MASPIALAVQGVPTGATSSLNPSYIPPGGAVTSFTMTIQTPLAAFVRKTRPGSGRASGKGLLAILLLPGIAFARRRRMRVGFLAFACCLFFTTLVTGCGNRINTDNAAIQSTTYTLTVTGTATGPTGNALIHTAVVTLQVLQ